MADIFSKEKRSQIMALISGKETKLEVAVRSYLFKSGFRFRKNVQTLKGKPDIVLSKYKTVIFIHGCFWHGHTCKKATKPTSNVEFWNTKINQTVERDLKINQQLQELGWKVITIWECDIKNKTSFESIMEGLIKKLHK